MQAGFAFDDHAQSAGQFDTQGLVHTGGERGIVAIATNGQVAEEFLFPHDHAGVLAALADQAGEVGMVQRRLGLGAGGRALLVNIGCGHKAPS
ncbi:hypothetical protein D3C72_1652830 [compost metagenome]